jgi:hypothetical protein
MLSEPGVNFTNILLAAFLYERVFLTLTYSLALQFFGKILLAQKIPVNGGEIDYSYSYS